MRRLALLTLVLAACSGSSNLEGSTTVPVTTTPVTTSPATVAPATTTPETTTPATTSPQTTTPVGATACPEVLAADFRQTAPGVFTVSATVRSVDIEGVSFADAWEVRDLAGTVLGTRILAHPHANEQPFTRSLSDVNIPSEITEVVVDARDSARGYCGIALVAEVPHS